MDSPFLDMLWEKIAAAVIFAANGFDAALAPFHFLGPATIIFLLAVLTVLMTKALNRIIVTRRYVRLEKEFKRLYNLRQAAMECEDREKGRLMAKNIDKAELNRAYYDYFFESLLLGLVRRIMPIFAVLAYINEYFKPERLIELFGHSHVLKLGSAGGEPVLIGSIVWYILSLILLYLAWAIVKFGYGRYKKKASPLPAEPTPEPT